MIFILETIFFVDEFIHGHTHLRNILQAEAGFQMPHLPPFFSQQALSDERRCENVASHGGTEGVDEGGKGRSESLCN